METRKEKAMRLFEEGYNCSQSVIGAFCDMYGLDFETAMRLSTSFGGGMGRMREVCGAVSGMLMVAGLESGTTNGEDKLGKKENYDVVQELARKFKERSGGSIICRELLGLEQQQDFTDTKPEERTKEYYKKRPCSELVGEAADIIETELLPLTIRSAKTEDDLHKIARLATVVWHEHYKDILSKEQIDYMVEKFQSFDAMKKQISEEGYQYLMLENGGGLAGYIGYHMEENSLFLSKLYLKKICRRRGYATQALAYLMKLAKTEGKHRIWLTVNKHNSGSIAFYQKSGFTTFAEETTEIGHGYVMDDYFMEKLISHRI